MKRTRFLRYLREQGCEFEREGARHSWWQNPSLNRRPAVPRHSGIVDQLARKICKDLGVPPISRGK
ncbi:MAG TPA: type II toxin-antitoxin system HicA family toxin [Planctomycetota bacterium]|nr:type II toxin-antitoxin system HicA family toxin [Planctomycetota bacterium]HRR80854.1 type II toxin-antitoxin system HicA family toxin [Planctomycetota bacterium]HRT95957.1 type II toxin-antitoxin system HicA family toxin [Planctomycetota bacterium]